MFKWLGKAKQYFSKKKKPPEVSQTRSSSSSSRNPQRLNAKRQASLKSQKLVTSPAKRDPKQKWKLRLHVIGAKDKVTGGHSFLSLIDPSGKNEMVMGMRAYGDNLVDSLRVPTTGIPGVINDDSIDLKQNIPRSSDNLVSKTWEISERQALAAMAKFNRDRRLNQERLPDLSKEGIDKLRKRQEQIQRGDAKAMRTEAGGPQYNMITNNCANWSLSVIEETQNPKVLEKMPGIPGQKDTKIKTSQFRKMGLAIPHHMRKHLPEKGAAMDYQERMEEVKKEVEERQRKQKERERLERRKNIFKTLSEDPSKIKELHDDLEDLPVAYALCEVLENRDPNVPPGTKLTKDEIKRMGIQDDKVAMKELEEIGALDQADRKRDIFKELGGNPSPEKFQELIKEHYQGKENKVLENVYRVLVMRQMSGGSPEAKLTKDEMEQWNLQSDEARKELEKIGAIDPPQQKVKVKVKEKEPPGIEL